MRPDGLVHSDGPAILAGSDAPILQVPDGFDIFSARYSRDGDDLVLAAEGSPPLTVIDYFTVDSPPGLEMPSGAMLRGDVVELLAGPRAPGQYAQADAPEAGESIGRVETLSGSSTATRVSGETVELAQGDPVFQGDVIETAGDSTLGMRLEDGTLASMSSHSRLVLNEFVFETGGSDNWMLVNLVEGAFAFLTGAIAPSGGMEITTPVAVMAIRGTMPVAFVAGDGGASQFFAASSQSYELLSVLTGEVLGIVTSAAGFSLSSPDAALETIELDPETQGEIEGLLQTLNDAAAELGLLGIQDDSGFHTYTPFGSIDGNLASLIQFLLLLDGALTEDAVLEVNDPDQFLMAEAELIASPDQAATDELTSIIINVLDNDSHPDNGDLTVVFADVPNGQGSVTIVDGQYLVFDPGTDFDYLALGETTTVVITYVVADSTGATASTTVTVTLTGVNQAPVINPVGQTSLDEQTDTQPLKATIAVTFTDVDLNNVGHQAAVVGVAVKGEAGGLTLNNAALMALVSPGTVIKNAGDSNGSVDFFFTAGSTVFDYLAEGEILTLTYTVQIDDGDGGTTLQTFDVTITGTNDAAVLSSADVTKAETDAALQFSGQLTISDVDNDDKFVAQTGVAGDYGTFSIDEDGNWTYTANSAFDHLNVGDSISETFTVAAVDGTTTTVKVTITGTNDAPVVDLNGAGAGIDNAVTFDREGPVEIAADGVLADVDDDTLQSMMVKLTDRPDGNNESLSLTSAAMTLATAAGLVVHAYDPANGTLLITGEASLAQYKEILQGVVYDNASERPSGGDRVIEVVVSDGDLSSAVATTTVDVIPAPDVISFAWLTVTHPEPNEYQVDDLGTTHERLFAIVGDGDQTLEDGETAYRLSNNDNTRGGILNDNKEDDPVLITPNRRDVTFDNDTGFGVKEQGSGDVNDAFLNDGESINFLLTGSMVLAVVAFTVNASGASANVLISFNGVSFTGVKFDLGNLSNNTTVTFDFVNRTIELDQGQSLPPNFDAQAFFEAYEAAGSDEITIGASDDGGAFSIQDLQLTPKDPSSGTDPIILDLGAPGFDLSATAAFDLNNDGEQQLLGWPSGEDGILVMDLDGSGAIESGNEVFSPYFDGRDFADALEALASLDLNGDNVINAWDPAFADLLVWVDENTDGRSQSGELFSLAELGITSINLDAQGVAYTIDGQNIVAEGLFTRTDGSTGDFVAVELVELAEPQSELFAVTDLTMDEVIIDYRPGDVIDLTRLGFELATGQLNADAAAEYVVYDSVEGVLWIDVDGAGGEAEFQVAAELVTATRSIFVRLSDGDSTADIQIA